MNKNDYFILLDFLGRKLIESQKCEIIGNYF